MDNIKVSIIMPVYNSGKHLQVAVDSILNQSLQDIELILVDDGSTDGSSEKCDEYEQQDNRVVVIHQKNGGICAARNAALSIAKGEYIGFSDHDDEYSPGQLMDSYSRIKQSGVDIIKFGHFTIYFRNGEIIRRDKYAFDDAIYTNEQIKDLFWKLWYNNAFGCVWDALFRKSFLIEHNIEFNKYFKTGGEDFDFFWHCLGQGASMEFSSKVYYNHYLRIGFSTSAKYNEYTITAILNRIDILFSYIQEWLPTLEEQKLEYTFFWLQTVLGSLCNTLGHPQCKIDGKEKIEILKSLKKNSYYKDWMMSVSFVRLAKMYPLKYALLLWLYKNDFYDQCISLYRVKYKHTMK